MNNAWLFCFAVFLTTSCSTPKEVSPSDTLVWCGLDYGKVKMIGTMDFRQPDKIFPGMLQQWNGLFIKEMYPQIEGMARSVQTDLQVVDDNNLKASASQIDRVDGSRDEMVKNSHITEGEIADIIRRYQLKREAGLGLVFIMDRLVKAQATACMYVVFFDISTRKVILSQRFCDNAGGGGFRNYWFRPIKETVDELPKLYRRAKTQR